MERRNQTKVTEFILLGLSSHPQTQMILFAVFLIVYTITMVGNALIILLSRLDRRLHTPMYFFLSNLSLLDLCYTTSIVPKMLANLLLHTRSISFNGCMVQMCIHLSIGGSECYVLLSMAYDRYVAICRPLHYTIMMSTAVCLKLAACSWLAGIINSLLHTIFALHLDYCGPNEIDHFLCEIPLVLATACNDASMNRTVIFYCAILVVISPFFLIMITYVYIIITILKMHSALGRQKAFSTCASHIIVVSLFYGTIIFMYMRPDSKGSRYQSKMATLFYSVVTPMLNPLIYSLRNKDVKGALLKVTCRKLD